MKKINNPLRVHKGKYEGENWLIADFGTDEEGNQYTVTTVI